MKKNFVTILRKATPHALKDINHLVSQLSLGATPCAPLTYAQLQELVSQENAFLLTILVKEGKRKKIIGFQMLYFVRIPSGVFAALEDLFVEETYRKWGAGPMLMTYAIDFAEKGGARHISLRTNPKRIEANKLYQQLGFHLMPTNFYRINLPRKR